MEIEYDCEIADHSTKAESDKMEPDADGDPSDLLSLSKQWVLCYLFSNAYSEVTQLWNGRAEIDEAGRVIHDTVCHCACGKLKTQVECKCEFNDIRDPVNSEQVNSLK